MLSRSGTTSSVHLAFRVFEGLRGSLLMLVTSSFCHYSLGLILLD